MPVILDYPHGCFDQISTKLLGYSFLANLIAYLPDIDARDAEYRATLERGMKQFNDSLLADGMLPYWPGGDTGNPFVTCQAFWAVNESVNAGFEAPEGLRDKLAAALKKIVNGQTSSNSFEKCFALFVLTQYEQDDDYKSIAHELYLRRNETGDEGRALLAIALHRQDIMPKEKEQLLREIDAPIKQRAFDPRTLSSATRAEAISALAFDTIAPKIWTAQKKQRIRQRMLVLMDSSAALSTQENLWLLLEFKTMIGAEKAEALNSTIPKGVVSKNGRSAAWIDRKIGDDLVVKGLNKGALNFLLQAEYSTDEVDTDRVDRGFRVERVVKNLTDAKRSGASDAPFKLGDQILITYRMNTRKLQNYVALEDSLPAGLETVNPNLAMIGKFFELPPTDEHDHTLFLSHSEMRDRSTLLYFDSFEPGSGTYSVLARATAAGNLSLAGHASRADVRQPFLRPFAVEFMRDFGRLISLGSARALACWRRRPRRRKLFGRLNLDDAFRRGHRNVHARARALPRNSRRRFSIVCVLSLVAIAIGIWWLPLPNELKKPTIGTLTLLDCRGREIAELASAEARAQLPRPLNEMGKWLPGVTIALEDHRFYEHAGVDWRATAAAFARNIKSGRVVSGGSTITQQLVKIASGRHRRSWTGKIYETICAWKLERRWSKERIITEYLNRSSYGNRRLGPEAAARAYFGKSARDLTLSESIFLAGLPQAPTRFNPWKHPERAKQKYERSLARLAQLRVITPGQQLFFAKAVPTIRRFDPLASRAALCRCSCRAKPKIARDDPHLARPRSSTESGATSSFAPRSA